MNVFLQFESMVNEHGVNFLVYEEPPKVRVDGRFISGGEPVKKDHFGIVGPISTDDLRREANGTYTSKDRKIVTLQPLAIGQKIEYKGQTYTIDRTRPIEDFSDVYIYYARGMG